MPSYCYTCPQCQATTTVVRSIHEAEIVPACQSCSDMAATLQLMKRDFVAERPGVPSPANWPMVSVAAGVHASQIPEAVKVAREAGVPTEFTGDGCPIFRDRHHRRRYLRLRGYHDRDGGYGD